MFSYRSSSQTAGHGEFVLMCSLSDHGCHRPEHDLHGHRAEVDRGAQKIKRPFATDLQKLLTRNALRTAPRTKPRVSPTSLACG
jgi:hypothetical protein